MIKKFGKSLLTITLAASMVLTALTIPQTKLSADAAGEKSYSDLYEGGKKGLEWMALDGYSSLSDDQRVLDSGIYYISGTSLTFTGTDRTSTSTELQGGNGLKIKEGATVYIYIGEGKTLTCKGGKGKDATNGGKVLSSHSETGQWYIVGTKDTTNGHYTVYASYIEDTSNYEMVTNVNDKAPKGGNGGGGGGAGILVPATSKLVILGPGTLNVEGGAGGAGGASGAGSDENILKIFSCSNKGQTENTFTFKCYTNNKYYTYYSDNNYTEGVSDYFEKQKRSKPLLKDNVILQESDDNKKTYNQLLHTLGAGGAGGGGAGGGGAAIGTNGSDGTLGLDGNATANQPLVNASNWIDSSGKAKVNYTPLTKSSDKLTDLNQPSKSSLCGDVKVSITSKTITPGAGGKIGNVNTSLPGPDDDLTGEKAFKSDFYDTSYHEYTLTAYLSSARPGGAGSKGGDGAKIGTGGIGGYGGGGGSAGLVREAAPSNTDSYSFFGYTYTGDATNGSEVSEITNASLSNTITFQGAKGTEKYTYNPCEAYDIAIPDELPGSDKSLVCWKVVKAGIKLPSTTVPSNVNDAKLCTVGSYVYPTATVTSLVNTDSAEIYGDIVLQPLYIKRTESRFSYPSTGIYNPEYLLYPGTTEVPYGKFSIDPASSEYAEMTADGKIKIKKTGTIKVNYGYAGNSSFPAYSATTNIIVDKAAIHPSMSMSSWEYEETPTEHKPYFSGVPSSIDLDGNLVSYTYYVDTPLIDENRTTSANSGAAGIGMVPKNVGTYYIKADIAESDFYEGAEASATFSITKKQISDPLSVTITNEPLVYNGQTQGIGKGLTLSVKLDGKALDESNYTITGTTTAKDAGAYTLYVTGVGNYAGTVPVNWTIAPKNLNSSDISVTQKGVLAYTGVEQTNAIAVKDNSVILREGTDFYVSSDSVVKATEPGTYNVKILGSANYTGTRTVTWKLLAGLNPTVSMSGWEYGSTPSEPSVTITTWPSEIGDSPSFEYSYKYYTDSMCLTETTSDDGATSNGGRPSKIGTYYVEATVGEMYLEADPTVLATVESTAVTSFTISPMTVTISVDDWEYGETAKTPEVNIPSAADAMTSSVAYYMDSLCKTKTTAANSGAEVAGGVPKNAGTYYAKLTVKDNGEEIGSAQCSFNINRKALTTGDVQLDYISFRYDGLVHSVRVISSLEKNKDYTITTDSDMSASESNTGSEVNKVVVEGIGNYNGSVTLEWRIVPRENVTISVADWEYAGTASEPVISAVPTGMTTSVTYYSDATCTIKTNESNSGAETIGGVPKNAGTYFAKVIVWDNGENAGDDQCSFRISQKTLEISDIQLDCTSFRYNGRVHSVQVISTGSLEKNRDYTITAESELSAVDVSVAPKKYEVVVQGIGNYKGSVTLEWEIIPKEAVTINIAGWEYGATASEPVISAVPTGMTTSVTYYSDASCMTKTTAKNSGASVAGGVPKNAGTYYAKVTVWDNGVDVGDAQCSFTVSQKELTSADVKLDYTSVRYDNHMHSVQVSSTGSLIKNKDYTITADSELNAVEANTGTETYKIIVQGIGNYTGSVTLEWRIIPREAVMMNLADWEYGGTASEPDIDIPQATAGMTTSVTYYTDVACITRTDAKNSGALKIGGVPQNAGLYYAKVTVWDAAGKDIGDAQCSFSINKKSIKDAIVQLDNPITRYDGNSKSVKITSVKLKNETKELQKNTDYTITADSVFNAVEEGVYTITVLGVGNYEDQAEITWEITSDATKINAGASIKDWQYGDTPNEPVIEGNEAGAAVVGYYYIDGGCTKKTNLENSGAASEGGVPTVAGTYYYKAEIAATESTKSGAAICSFNITPKKLTNDMVKLSEYGFIYDGETKSVEVSVVQGERILVKGTDYNIDASSVMRSAESGTFRVEVVGTGNYTGIAGVNWTVCVSAGTDKLEIFYDGLAHTAVPSVAIETDAPIMYGETEGVFNLSEIPYYIDAGEYVIYYQMEMEDGNFSDGTSTLIIKPVEVKGKATAESKVYDGTTLTKLTPEGPISGVNGEIITITSAFGNFADKKAGKNKAVISDPNSVQGTVAGGREKIENYTVVLEGAKAAIQKKEVSVVSTAISRPYNGSSMVQLQGSVGAGIIDGDECFVASVMAMMDDASIGENKKVTISDVVFGGADADNYEATEISETTVTITPCSIEGAVVTLGKKLHYTGQKQKQKLKSVQVNGIDATVEVDGNIATNIGSYEMTITGVGNFCGSIKKSYDIAPETNRSYLIGDNEDVNYENGGEVVLSVEVDSEEIEAKFKSSKAEVINMIATTYEMQQVGSGEDLDIWMDVSDISDTIDTDVKQLFERVADDFKVVSYYDINLFKKLTSENDTTHIDETAENLKVAIMIPDEIADDAELAMAEFYVIRYHEGAAEKLLATYSPVTKMLSFETNKYSAYALIYRTPSMKKLAEDISGDGVLVDVVPTEEVIEQERFGFNYGDILVGFLVVATAACAANVAIYVFKQERKRRK